MVCFPTILVDFVMANVGRYTIHGCYGKTEKKKKRTSFDLFNCAVRIVRDKQS